MGREGQKFIGDPHFTRIRKPAMYIHYGAERFDPDKWKPIANRDATMTHGWIKPAAHTGLWASPVDSEQSWRHWCEAEHYGSDLDKGFKLRLRDPGRIFYVTNRIAYKLLCDCYGIVTPWGTSNYQPYYFDFEKMVLDGWDGLEISLSEYPPLYDLFYTWDCDSICIFNKDAIKEVPDDEFDKVIHPERRDSLGDVFGEWDAALSHYIPT